MHSRHFICQQWQPWWIMLTVSLNCSILGRDPVHSSGCIPFFTFWSCHSASFDKGDLIIFHSILQSNIQSPRKLSKRVLPLSFPCDLLMMCSSMQVAWLFIRLTCCITKLESKNTFVLCSCIWRRKSHNPKLEMKQFISSVLSWPIGLQ